MKLYVQQMMDWNCYAFCAENVEQAYWDYFKNELWWQVGNHFIKTYDNVQDFSYCAENFAKYGETAIQQQLKIIPAPWEKALNFLVPGMKKLEVDWYVHGSAAMALWGIAVEPKDLNVIVPNYSDYEKVRDHFFSLAIRPFERCENWLMSGLGDIFVEATIGFAFCNQELEPYDLSKLEKIVYKGEEVYISSLEMLKQDNEHFHRPDRVQKIVERMERSRTR